ncbi:MAG: 3',5'-cyclic-AMP phosphodiesterase [Methylococcaceae bacterium]|nr:3',5'-cyclic-AMP phosphodiesterase [Methylococcaceae bacterium]
MTQIPGRLSLLQITDMHILPRPEDTLLGINTNYYFNAVLAAAFAERPHYDLILLTGDLAQEPCPASYQQILNSLLPYQTHCVCLPGNHDDYSLMQQVLNTDQISCNKQVFIGNWQLICLNSQIPGSPGGRLANEELIFLEQCLTDNPDVPTLIAFHHHCLETNSTWMDTMTITNSQAFFSIIKNYSQIKAITTGHIHQVMDTTINTIRVFGTPSTCFQFKPKSRDFGLDTIGPGYRTLDLYNDGRIESTVIRLQEPLKGLQLNSQGY